MDVSKKYDTNDLAKTLKSLIHSTFKDEGKLLVNQDGLILDFNLEKLQLDTAGYTNLLDFLRSEATLDTSLPNHLEKDNENLDIEFTMQNESEYYRLLLSPIHFDEQVTFLAQIFKITKSKQALKQLSNRRKSIENEMFLRTQEIVMTEQAMSSNGGFLTNFLRGLRHDLISPVTQLKAIIAFYQDTDDPVKKKRSSELIDSSLQKLSDTAVGFSRFVDTHITLDDDIQFIDLQTVYQKTRDVLKAEIEESNATLSFSLEHENDLVFIQKMLESVLFNLLSNAIKYRDMDRQLKIDIRSYDSSDGVKIEVKDNGIGIDLVKHKAKLFTPFSRFTTDRSGAGIGLSLTKNILVKRDGHIELESEVDKYTKVIVFIPAGEASLVGE